MGPAGFVKGDLVLPVLDAVAVQNNLIDVDQL
jgi:hypothetical protein